MPGLLANTKYVWLGAKPDLPTALFENLLNLFYQICKNSHPTSVGFVMKLRTAEDIDPEDLDTEISEPMMSPGL